MKFDFNRKYNTIAIYTLIVIALGAAIVTAIANISQVGTFVSKAFSIITPFLWGFAIAYILTPVLKYFERTLGRIFKNKLKPRLLRTLSVIGTYLFALIVLVVFFWIVAPQIAQSFATLASQVPGWVERLRVFAMEMIEKYDLQNLDFGQLESTTFDKLLNTLQDFCEKRVVLGFQRRDGYDTVQEFGFRGALNAVFTELARRLVGNIALSFGCLPDFSLQFFSGS